MLKTIDSRQKLGAFAKNSFMTGFSLGGLNNVMRANQIATANEPIPSNCGLKYKNAFLITNKATYPPKKPVLRARL